jgi:hypothetical protein
LDLDQALGALEPRLQPSGLAFELCDLAVV